MQTVNFIPSNSPNALTFVFKAHKNAEELYRRGLSALKNGEIIECEDDFGTQGVLKMSDIAAITFGEYERDMEKNGDLQIIQHKCQLKMQSKAKNDIGLQLLDKQVNSGIVSQ